MKELLENKTVTMFVAILIIIGFIMVATNGFNESSENSNGTRISIYMYQDFEIEDIKNIAQEVLNKNVEARYIGFFKDAVSINADDINNEQLDTLKEKIAEKYTWDDDKQKITTNFTVKTNLMDEVQKYISSILISFIIIAVYLAVRFKSAKNITSLVAKVIAVQLLFFSLIAIAREPLNRDTISIALFVYILAIIIETVNINKKYYLDNEKAKEE